MSLLGYLVPRIAASGEEPAATQALAYLLNASTEVAEAFVGVVAPTGIEAFTPGRIAAEEQHGSDFPDLTIRDTDGVVRILVENKFWAGLTSAQPVAYLEALPADVSSLLVFIAPHQRGYGLWGELRERCRRSKIQLAGESKGGDITWARAGRRTLAITSWRHVLGRLEEAAADPALRQDIAQLRGLTDRMNVDAFLPLHEDEVTDANVARRLINYTGLIDEIVGRLKTDGIAGTKKLGSSYGYQFAGRFLRVHSRFNLWLGVHHRSWCARGITPIWTAHNTNTSSSGIEGKILQAKELFNDARAVKGQLYIPIRLTTGADRDRVIDDAVRQMHSIADRLREEFPDG